MLSLQLVLGEPVLPSAPFRFASPLGHLQVRFARFLGLPADEALYGMILEILPLALGGIAWMRPSGRPAVLCSNRPGIVCFALLHIYLCQ